MGETILAKDLEETGVPVFSAGRENKPWGFLKNPKRIYGHETVVLSARGSIGFPKIPIDKAFTSTQTTIALRFPSPNLAQLACYWLNSIDWGARTSGCSIPMLTVGEISSLEMPLPPESEQRRIVVKLEALLAKVDSSRKRMERIPIILKRFRQAVLAAACEGRLTADWRDGQPSPPSALILLAQIKEARKTQQSRPRRGVNPEVAIQALAPHEQPDESLPESWTWVRFGDVIGDLKNGISTRPEMQPPGMPILRISAARPGAVDLSDIRYLPNGEEYASTSSLLEGDLLFTRYNGSIELLGVCGMVRGLNGRTILYPDKLMRVRFDHNMILPEYAEIFFQCQKVHDRITDRSKSSAGQNGVSGSDIKDQAFALPPTQEQAEIVRRVKNLLAIAKPIEARYLKAKAQVDRLTQSLLAKAFRGELVPQDPNDEPAEAMLARLRGEGSDAPMQKPRRGCPAKATTKQSK
jgi:type I restriction enzyme S subunit